MIATSDRQFTTKELTATLDHLGVHFVMGEMDCDLSTAIDSPTDLLIGLASSNEARIRLALVPLFLRHPHHADYVHSALAELPNSQSDTLRCFYTAAQLLQEKYHAQLLKFFGESSTLPSLFKQELELERVACPDSRLLQLAKRQADLTGKPLNWYGTYQHAYNRLIKYEACRKAYPNR